MLVLPIVNVDRILHVEVKLKSANKIKSGIRFSDASESEIIVNGKLFSESLYKDDKSRRAVVDFIRNTSLRNKRNFLVTTREEASSNSYDVYEILQPPKKVNDGLDNLWGSLIIDLSKEIPGHNRGRYLSLKALGVGDHLTDEKLEKLEYIVKNVSDTSRWPELFQREGVMDLVETLDFLNSFECTVVPNSTVSEKQIQSITSAFSKVNTREARNMNSYYNMACDNRDIYSKLSDINKLVYGKPLGLIKSEHQKQRQFVKTNVSKGEILIGKAA